MRLEPFFVAKIFLKRLPCVKGGGTRSVTEGLLQSQNLSQDNPSPLPAELPDHSSGGILARGCLGQFLCKMLLRTVFFIGRAA